MQALVLAGGEGTRLQPLTLSLPKPVIPLAGRPFLTFMLDWLVGQGVDDVILSCGFASGEVKRVLGERHGGARLRYAIEEAPLGTAGPLRLAHSMGLLDQRVLVLNGDILCDFDLSAQIAWHERNAAGATLALVGVEDTSSYGVVPTRANGEVEAFLEKEEGPAPTNRVNAGVYVLERTILEAIPAGRAVSLERDVFPGLVGHGLFGFPVEGYWIDIGTPERYLEATRDLLGGAVSSTLGPLNGSSSVIGAGSLVEGARIGPLSVLGRDCFVAPGARVERSVLHDRVRVEHDCTVVGAVLAEGVRLAGGAHVEEGAVLGAGASVASGVRVGAGVRVEPGARVTEPRARVG